MLTVVQNIRRYATETPKPSGSNTPLLLGGAVLAAGGGYWYYSQQTDPDARARGGVPAAPSGKKAFVGGDQGFVSLKLESVDNVNHNTRKLRFALPEGDDVSGLNIACESRDIRWFGAAVTAWTTADGFQLRS